MYQRRGWGQNHVVTLIARKVKLYASLSGALSVKMIDVLGVTAELGVMLKNGELSIFAENQFKFLGWDFKQTSMNGGASEYDLDIGISAGVGGYSVGLHIDLAKLNVENLTGEGGAMSGSHRQVQEAVLRNQNAATQSSFVPKLTILQTVNYQYVQLGNNIYMISNYHSSYDFNKPADWSKTFDLTDKILTRNHEVIVDGEAGAMNRKNYNEFIHKRRQKVFIRNVNSPR